MKPESILKSSVLDIVFENRNKEYGAYELRKNYNTRIGKALGTTALVVILFGLTQSFKTTHKTGKFVPEVKDVFLADLNTPKVEPVKPKEEIKVKSSQAKKFETVQLTTIKIVPPTEPIKSMATVTEIEDKQIGIKTVEGIKAPQGVVITTPTNGGGGGNGSGNDGGEDNSVSNTPINFAEIMPQFPGGKEAFLKFMQKNLRQPEDFEDGQKLTVIAKFIVDAEGNIVDIDIIQNGRKDLDEEVIRVVKKMPKWNPGKQNGRNVSVYFKVPVTFVGAE